MAQQAQELAANIQIDLFSEKNENSPQDYLLPSEAQKKEKEEQASLLQAAVETNELLVQAAFDNNIELIKKLLAEGAAINGRSGGFQFTPLMAAALSGHSESVKCLLAAKADYNCTDINECTAFNIAVSKGHHDCVKLLFEAGSQVNPKEVMVAARYGHVEVLRFLLDNGCPIDVRYKGETALIRAARNGHPACVQLLLFRGCDINALDNNGANALHSAYDSCVDLLLAAGIAVNNVANNGDNALMHSSPKGSQLLLQYGININNINKQGVTALRAASISGHVEKLRLLLEHGAIINLVAHQPDDIQMAHSWPCKELLYDAAARQQRALAPVLPSQTPQQEVKKSKRFTFTK